MNYKRLLDKYDDMKLYSIVVTSEYVEKVVKDTGNVMKISIDEEKINKAFLNKLTIGEDKVCYFEDGEDDRCFIMADCRDTDYIYSVIVRCTDIISQQVRNILLKWDKIVREENGQSLSSDLPDWMHNYKYDEKYNPLINSLRINKLIE